MPAVNESPKQNIFGLDFNADDDNDGDDAPVAAAAADNDDARVEKDSQMLAFIIVRNASNVVNNVGCLPRRNIFPAFV